MQRLAERCMKNSRSKSGRIPTRLNVSAHFNLSLKTAAEANGMVKCRIGSILKNLVSRVSGCDSGTLKVQRGQGNSLSPRAFRGV